VCLFRGSVALMHKGTNMTKDNAFVGLLQEWYKHLPHDPAALTLPLKFSGHDAVWLKLSAMLPGSGYMKHWPHCLGQNFAAITFTHGQGFLG